MSIIETTLIFAGIPAAVIVLIAGASYAGYNRALAVESRPRENLRVVNWARMVHQHPEWLSGDGVHVNVDGYKARAKAVAESVRRCR